MKTKSGKPKTESCESPSGTDTSKHENLIVADVHYMARTYEIEFPPTTNAYDLKEELSKNLGLGYFWDLGVRTTERIIELQASEIVADYADESGKLTLYIMPNVCHAA